MTALSPAQVLSQPRRRDHIIDVLIVERAPNLSATPLWPFLRPLLYRLLDYGKARRMADAIAPLPGREALDHVSRILALNVAASGLDRIPRTAQGAPGVQAIEIIDGSPRGISLVIDPSCNVIGEVLSEHEGRSQPIDATL